MNFDLFLTSVQNRKQLKGLPAPLQALWLDAVGDWDGAHEAIQDEGDRASAAVHAYLHRKEGDLWNARYWYKNAGRRPFDGTLVAEWESLSREFLDGSGAQQELR
jgi:hypothetical protein